MKLDKYVHLAVYKNLAVVVMTTHLVFGDVRVNCVVLSKESVICQRLEKPGEDISCEESLKSCSYRALNRKLF